MFPISHPCQIADAHRYVIASNPEVMIVSPIHADNPRDAHYEAKDVANRIQADYPRASVIVTNFKPGRDSFGLLSHTMFTCDHPEEYFPRRYDVKA